MRVCFLFLLLLSRIGLTFVETPSVCLFHVFEHFCGTQKVKSCHQDDDHSESLSGLLYNRV